LFEIIICFCLLYTKPVKLKQPHQPENLHNSVISKELTKSSISTFEKKAFSINLFSKTTKVSLENGVAYVSVTPLAKTQMFFHVLSASILLRKSLVIDAHFLSYYHSFVNFKKALITLQFSKKRLCATIKIPCIWRTFVELES
jgi:hypothetical protein